MADSPKIKLDVTVYTVGDVLDLSDSAIELPDKLRIIEKGVVEGNLRDVPLVHLADVIMQITEEVNATSNPT